MSQNSKTVGDRSEGCVLAALLNAGKIVLLPFGDNQRYDLVFEEDGAFRRVQCKTGRISNGAIEFPTCSSYNHRGRPHKDYVGQADFFGVYCPDNGKVYLVPVADVGLRGATLRLDAPKNGQQKRIRLAALYEVVSGT